MIIDGFTVLGNWPGLASDSSVETLVSALGRFKLDKACTLSSKGIFFSAEAGNAETWASCQAEPRLVPIGVADPRMGGIAHVDYCAEQGFRLIALFPVSQGWSLQNIAAQAVLQRITEANLAVFIEAGREGDASAIYAATRTLDIPVVLLDVSLLTLTEAMAVVRDRQNTYLTTRLLCGGDTIELLVGALGANRLIFASRSPISCFSSAFLTAQFANISDGDRAAVMGGTLERLLA
jgi:predicted TIM-barrel fold metal-dependent hydrolase